MIRPDEERATDTVRAAAARDAVDGAPPAASTAMASQDPPGTSSPMASVEADGGNDEDGGKKKKKKKEKKKEGIGTSRGIETMFRTSYRTHLDLSTLADTKANIMISINGIIISIIIASISPKIDANPWLLVPTAGLLLACMGSMVFAILAARPRVSSKVVSLEDVRSNRKNILFFGNFVNMPEDEYLDGMKELMADTDRLYSNMVRDIYSLGAVLSRKYALVRIAYNIFMVGLSIAVLLFVGVLTWAAFTQGFTASG